MATLQVELVSPERVAYTGEATMVIARTLRGDVAFQPGHVPFLGTLQTHMVRVFEEDGGVKTIAVHQGFVNVANSKVTVLSDICEMAEDIDVARAEQAKAAAEETLRAGDDPVAAEALRRAETRLEVASRR